MMTTVDARGLSCPEPVVLTMKAVSTNENSYEVLVDSPVCVENVSRFAKNKGFQVAVKPDGDTFILTLTR